MNNFISNIEFYFIALVFKIRDWFRPRQKILKEVKIKEGDIILDYGCGPGTYSLLAAKITGNSGKVYALDINPIAVKNIKNVAQKADISNIETICSDCDTGLSDESVNIIFLYDIFHLLNEPAKIIAELYRVLKKDGILSFSDHHMNNKDIISQMDKFGLFALSHNGEFTYTFIKI